MCSTTCSTYLLYVYHCISLISWGWLYKSNFLAYACQLEHPRHLAHPRNFIAICTSAYGSWFTKHVGENMPSKANVSINLEPLQPVDPSPKRDVDPIVTFTTKTTHIFVWMPLLRSAKWEINRKYNETALSQHTSPACSDFSPSRLSMPFTLNPLLLICL